MDIAARVEDIELGAVRVGCHARGAQLRDDRRRVDGGVDGDARRGGDDDAAAGYEQRRDRAADRKSRARSHEVARRLRHRALEEFGVRRPEDARAVEDQGTHTERALHHVAAHGAVARAKGDDAVGRGVRAGAVGTDGEGHGVRARRGLVTDDAIVAEREDAERHDLFREMRMRPLVRIALREELERGARVIDLVEVHVARVIEPVSARQEDGDRNEQRDRKVAAGRRMSRRERRRQAPGRARLSPRNRRRW